MMKSLYTKKKFEIISKRLKKKFDIEKSKNKKILIRMTRRQWGEKEPTPQNIVQFIHSFIVLSLHCVSSFKKK